MGKDFLDRNIKSELEDYNSPMDLNSFWDNLEPKIERSKKRRRVFLWLLLPLFFVVGLIIHLAFNEEDASKADIKNVSGYDQASYDDKDNLNSKNDIKLDLSNNEVILSDVKTSHQEKFEEKINASYKQNTIDESQVDERLKKINASNAVTSSITYDSEVTFNESTKIGQNRDNQHQLDLINTGLAVEESIHNIDRAIHLESISILWNDIMAESQQFLPSVRLTENLKIDRKLNQVQKHNLNFWTDYEFLNRNLSTTNDSLISFIPFRNSSETSLERLRLSLEYTYAMTENWSVVSGLSLGQISERLVYSEFMDSIVQLDNVIIGSTVNDNGTVTDLYGQGRFLNYYETVYTKYNLYRTLDIIFGLSYKKRIGKFGLGAEIAFLGNLNFSQKGNYLIDVSSSDDLTNLSYKSRLGIGTQIRLPISYKLSDNWGLGMRFTYNARKGRSLTEESAGFHHSYSSWGIGLGLSRSF